MNFVIILHAMVCLLLCVVILMQAGKGGGLTETFASAESMFGAKTNEFMIKTTSVLAVLFLMTCLGLAFFSSQKDKSLMTAQSLTQDAENRVGIPLDESTLNATLP